MTATMSPLDLRPSTPDPVDETVQVPIVLLKWLMDMVGNRVVLDSHDLMLFAERKPMSLEWYKANDPYQVIFTLKEQ